MKETVNANIGSQAFTLDLDAFGTLHSYLDDIRSRLPENDTETMSDIEARLAEIFCEKTGASTIRVITLQMVREAMLQMGAPAAFGERRGGEQTGSGPRECGTGNPQPSAAPRKLYRSRVERIIGGICGGIARYFDADPTVIRLITLLLIFLGGVSIWIYIILWIVIPEEPLQQNSYKF